LEYLATPEGRADVASADDPLGLFSHESHFAGLVDDAVDKMLHNLGVVSSFQTNASSSASNYCRNNHTSDGNARKKWSSRRSAFFAGLFVRAPLPVMKAIYDIEKETLLQAASCSTSSGDCQEDDLSSISETDWWIECFMCLLAVIPSRDEERLRSSTSPAAYGTNGSVVYRTRTWSIPEFESLILMLLNDHPSPEFSELESDPESISSSESHSNPSSALLRLSPKWIIHAPNTVALTPLAIAAYNPDISPAILRVLHRLEPRAIRKQCTLFGVDTIPLHVAAASPLPSKQTVSLASCNEARERRWKKVETLLVLSENLDQDAENADNNHGVEERRTKQPTMKQVQHTCRVAIQREEWELVREILKRYCHHPHHHRPHSSNLSVVPTEMKNNHVDNANHHHHHHHRCRHPMPQLEHIHKALLKHDTEIEIQSMQYLIAKEREERERSIRKNHVFVLDALRSVWMGLAFSWRRERGGTTTVSGGVVDPMS